MSDQDSQYSQVFGTPFEEVKLRYCEVYRGH